MSMRLSENDGFQIMETASLPNESILIIGLPDVGLVGLLAASHIVSTLRLEEAGSVESESLPPMIVLHGGVPKSPIRLFARGSTIVLVSETVIPNTLIRPLANCLVDFAKRKKIRLTLALGGMAVENRQNINTPQVYAALSSKALENRVSRSAEVLEEGYIVGAYGLLLRRCAVESIPAITLLTQSYYNYPDPVAAAASLNTVNKILDLKVDVAELLKRGEEIRLRSKDIMHRTHEEMNRMDKSHEYDLPPLYG